MDGLTETLRKEEENYKQAQQFYEKMTEKHKKASATVTAAQSTYDGVKNIGDEATIKASARLLQSVQLNLKQISTNLEISKAGVQAAKTNLENTRQAVELKRLNQQASKKVSSPNLFDRGGIDERKIDFAPEPPATEKSNHEADTHKDSSPVRMTRAQYRQQLQKGQH